MADFVAFWRDSEAGAPGTFLNAVNMGRVQASVSSDYARYLATDPGNARGILFRGGTYVKLRAPDAFGVARHCVFGVEDDFALPDVRQRLDEGTELLPGRDYSVYLRLLPPDAEFSAYRADFVVSLNSGCPANGNAGTTRRIGGFHTLCADAGEILGHPLSGLGAGDILPDSLWDLLHRPCCAPDGMTFVPGLGLWADVYLQSGTGAGARSAFGAGITTARCCMDHVDDLAAVGKRLLSDEEFQVAAAGSNEQGRMDARPETAGGHTDNNGRRMLSACGLEDCCGALWQWLGGGGWRFTDTGDAFHPIAVNPSADWPGGKGQIYHSDGRSGLIAGNMYGNTPAACGSRSRSGSVPRSVCDDKIACRGCAVPA
ncbi:MAG: hypothetical protein LBP38_01185 [Desulfovibrio sp.]|jgi:hypothetical protein|nr:hypothetical protein [Desulfovibrio sp.]